MTKKNYFTVFSKGLAPLCVLGCFIMSACEKDSDFVDPAATEIDSQVADTDNDNDSHSDLIKATDTDTGTESATTTSTATDVDTDTGDPKIRVFILAGQSNMVGHGKSEDGNSGPGTIGSLRYEVDNDPASYGHLVDEDGNWIARGDVKVWWRDSEVGESRAVLKGDLDIGFSQSRNPSWIGPEYAFGWVVGDFFAEPVLLIKTSWGGKSLHADFRPPSAVASRGGVVGPYYSAMIDYVNDVLSNLDTEFPEWAGMDYQIEGVGWHQGWNDGGGGEPTAEYEQNLADLIRDLRSDFGLPDMPVCIANTGIGGWSASGSRLEIINAQLAVADPARYPEFAGTVFTAETRDFWREAEVSPSDFGYHWNHNGETHFLIGDAMGRGMLDLLLGEP
jgi:alpha-galactosidase